MKYLTLLLLFTIGLNAQQLAFPTALGAGAYVSGGRGQTVYHVTNTDFNDNPGSFKWALETAVANNGGTIVFDVSGVITIQPTVVTSYDRWLVDSGTGNDSKVLTNISILGQTAPFPGITIETTNTTWEMGNVHNFIMRYIKFRSDGTRGFFNFRYCDELILDHVSMAYSSSSVTSANLSSVTDHNIDGTSWTPTDITCQYALFAHGGRFSNTGNSSGDPNADFGNVSFIRNAFHEISYRTPMKSGGDGQRDIINNIVSKFRSGKRVMRFDDQPVKINHISNIYTPSISNVLAGEGSVDNGHKIYTNNLTAFEIYNNGNDIGWTHIPDSGTTGDAERDFWDAFRPSGAEGNPDIPSDRFVNTQHPLVGRSYDIYDTSVLKDSILSEVGDNRYLDDNGNVVYYRDGIDTRYVNDIQNNTDRNLENTTGFATYGNFTSNTRPVNFYGTNGHIPTAWLTANGYSDTANIHNQVEPDGYTVLEHYANQVDNVTTKAFPTAYGAAAEVVTGGRGGTVIHVTNLNDSGAGSFREALQTSGTRTIVFDVSGVINLISDLVTTHGNFTVAGQTAPQGGITIIGTASIRVQADNHIWRYIRFRSGYDDSNVDGGWENTGSGVATRDYTDYIFDHCSAALAKETAGMGGGQNDTRPNIILTSQNNLVVESARGTLVGDSNDSDPSTVTVYKNGYINSGWRFPKAGGTIDLDVINTYVYNWQFRTIRMDGYDYKLNVIGNYYQAGNLTRLTDNSEIMYTTFTNQTMNPQIWDEDNEWESYVYNGGANTYDPKSGRNYPADKSTAWSPFFNSTDPIDTNWFVNSRLPLEGVTPPILPSNQVKDSVLDGSGANKYIDDNGVVQIYRDKIDLGAINIAKGLDNSYIINGVTYDLSDGTKLDQADYETIALGLVNDTPSFTRPGNFYGTNQHIPTAWLTANGYSDTANIHNQVEPDGYTVLEHYINQVDENVPIVNVNVTGVTVSPSTASININATTNLTETIAPINATDQTGVWSSSNGSVATVDQTGRVTGISEGSSTISFTTNDGTFTDTCVVTVNALVQVGGNGGTSKTKKILLINN